jgi:hypothetical protein
MCVHTIQIWDLAGRCRETEINSQVVYLKFVLFNPCIRARLPNYSQVTNVVATQLLASNVVVTQLLASNQRSGYPTTQK